TTSSHRPGSKQASSQLPTEHHRMHPSDHPDRLLYRRAIELVLNPLVCRIGVKSLHPIGAVEVGYIDQIWLEGQSRNRIWIQAPLDWLAIAAHHRLGLLLIALIPLRALWAKVCQLHEIQTLP